jgi:hypothetical protein
MAMKLHDIILKIWIMEEIPKDWSKKASSAQYIKEVT